MGTENASSSCFPSSSTSMPRWTYEYDVFLNFKGSDTRKKFTSHLYEALKRNGIITFRDDESLDRGAFIKPELLKAIEESKIAVVIFSRDYASSSWCLTELAKIVECMDKKKLTVLPVFHDVDPSDVRKLRGTFEDAFAKHLIDNTENVQTWKDAVSNVAGISGWDLRDEYESIVIKKIIQWINYELDREVLSFFEHLVGMESRVEEMLDLCLGERLDCVYFIGICDIGGIGKTTLAREIYNKILGDFEASSFIDNIREESENQHLVSLRKQLLSRILMSTQKNISNVYEGKSVSELVASMRKMKMGSCGSSGNQVGSLLPSGFKSPYASIVRPGFCSTPSTPAWNVTRSGLGSFDLWEMKCEEQPAMERVESGRGLRAQMYAKLRKENSLRRVDSAVSSPDFGWLSELVK